MRRLHRLCHVRLRRIRRLRPRQQILEVLPHPLGRLDEVVQRREGREELPSSGRRRAASSAQTRSRRMAHMRSMTVRRVERPRCGNCESMAGWFGVRWSSAEKLGLGEMVFFGVVTRMRNGRGPKLCRETVWMAVGLDRREEMRRDGGLRTWEVGRLLARHAEMVQRGALRVKSSRNEPLL